MKEKTRQGLLRKLSDNIFLIILAGVIGGLFAYYIDSNEREDKYKSVAKIFVSNEGYDKQQYDANDDLVLARDCSLILANRTVMTQVIVGLDLQLVYPDMREFTAEDMLKKVNICVPRGSRLIYIAVTDKNPARAKGLADAISVASVDYLKKGFGVARAEIVETANMPAAPIRYNFIINALYGFLAGLVIAILAVIILSKWDKRVKSEDDFYKLGLPVLAAIPIHEEIVYKSNNSSNEKKDENSDKAMEKEE